MSSAVIGKPPPGLDLSEDRIVQNDGIVAAVMAIATVFVGLRFWARTANRSASLEYDDWSLLVALVCNSIPKYETYSADGGVTRRSHMGQGYAAYSVQAKPPHWTTDLTNSNNIQAVHMALGNISG